MTRPRLERQQPPPDQVEALARLRASGGRITQSRRDLVGHFFTHDAGVTVDELLAHYPVFDPATLYRAVSALEQAGIIEHTHLGHGAATYKRAGAPTVSLVCHHCGGTIDVPRAELDPLAAALHASHGFVIDPHHFAITGTCHECIDGTQGDASLRISAWGDASG
jgi:Fur family ferric uptake transcriptional regulator